MTKKALIEALKKYPDNADVVVVNSNTLDRDDILFFTWKNSAERIQIYYGDKDGISR